MVWSIGGARKAGISGRAGAPSAQHIVAQISDLLTHLLAQVEDRLPPHTLQAVVLGATTILAIYVARALSRHWAEAAIKVTASVPEAASPQAALRPGATLLENPTLRDPQRPDQIQAYDPATGLYLAHIPADTPASITAKVARAQAAQREWCTTSYAQRRKFLKTLLKWVVDDAEAIAHVCCRDTGKSAVDAAFGEILTTCSKLEWTIANGEAVLRPEARAGNLLLAHKRCWVYHEPVGVVAACVSWNYPFHNVLGPLISALFAGNAIVLKASENVAWSSHFFIDAVRKMLSELGHSPDVVQLVTCWPEHAEALTTHEDIRHITFIGSEPVGKLVAAAAVKHLTPTVIELGGKDPAVILPSADLKYFNSTFLRAVFQGGGQNCIGLERFIVARSILPQFVALVKSRIEALRCGSYLDDAVPGPYLKDSAPVDVGAMINSARFDELESLISGAVQKGAQVLVGGKRLRSDKWKSGSFFAPTLISGVTRDMKIAQEEVFAPIMLIMPFDTLDEAIEIANSTRYGLGSSVFGAKREECHYVAQRLRAGMTNINDFGVSYLAQSLPFGGVKASGYGRFGGPEGLLGLTTPKAVTEDRFFRTVRTGIPPPLDYPLQPQSWAFVRSLVEFAYGSGLVQRARGIFGLIRGMDGPPPDFYGILGVSPTASTEEIREAYKRQSLKCHPDRFPNASPAERERHTARFQALADAYYVLSDAERRTEYDGVRSSYPSASSAEDPGANANFFRSFFSGGATHGEQPQADGVFGGVFEELLRPEVHRVAPVWKWVGSASGAGLGFILGNVPGAIGGAVLGNRLGAVRDAKGKSVAEVFINLSSSQKAEVLKALAAKVLGSMGDRP
ncbi:Meiotic Sister-Chromatid recombination aldehyde dehydrogenase [Tilletia horrida]|nr:Meiotic Sister-Chromatid recombination aldehyde dehydrogenase [Tilletia horrida]